MCVTREEKQTVTESIVAVFLFKSYSRHAAASSPLLMKTDAVEERPVLCLYVVEN